MSLVRPKGSLERGAAPDLWRRTLSQIPTVFGRLVYLARLRDPHSGLYEHHGLAAMFGESDADRALRASHMRAFQDWLNFSIEQQQADLDLYLAEQTRSKRSVLQHWVRVEEYRTFAPATAAEYEKKLFLANLTAILRLLTNAHGVAWPDPNA